MRTPRIVALSGGVGGARLIDGLRRALGEQAEDTLTAIVNTGDDFSHWGLHISPDLDTVMYTLAGLAHEARGYGLAEESFAALEMVKRYGGADWFALSDRDIGTHLVRTQALAQGESLSAITLRLCRALGVRVRVLPMADGPCRTLIELEPGACEGPSTRSFQDWFVRLRANPSVRRVFFEGDPAPAPGVLEAIERADLVVIGPSNPYVSIDPILTRRGVLSALAKRKVIAISPIVFGQAVKGPLAKMIPKLAGRAASAAAVAAHYQQILSGMIVERGDEIELLGQFPKLPVFPTATVMQNPEDRRQLGAELLGFAESLT